MWQQNYEPLSGSLGLSAIVAAIPILVLFYMLGVIRKPAWMAASAALAAAFVLALLVYGMPVQLAVMSALTGAAFGLFPIAWIVFSLHHALPASGRHRQVRNHQGFGRRPDQRPPAAGPAHRLFVRRVHRRRGRVRSAGRRGGRDAGRPRVLAFLCGRDLPAREHGAGGVRVDRHSGDRPLPASPGCRCCRSARWSDASAR